MGKIFDWLFTSPNGEPVFKKKGRKIQDPVDSDDTAESIKSWGELAPAPADVKPNTEEKPLKELKTATAVESITEEADFSTYDEEEIKTVRKKSKRHLDLVKPGEKTVPALIISPNNYKGIYVNKALEVDLLPEGTMPYFIEWEGKWMPILVQRGEKEYTPLETRETIHQLPEKLSRAVRMPAHRALWAMSKNPLEKIAVIAVAVVLCVALVLIFAFATQKPKQAPQDARINIEYNGGYAA